MTTTPNTKNQKSPTVRAGRARLSGMLKLSDWINKGATLSKELYLSISNQTKEEIASYMQDIGAIKFGELWTWKSNGRTLMVRFDNGLMSVHFSKKNPRYLGAKREAV